MMPKTQLFGELAGTSGTRDTVPAQASATKHEGGREFCDLMSQALAKGPGKAGGQGKGVKSSLRTGAPQELPSPTRTKADSGQAVVLDASTNVATTIVTGATQSSKKETLPITPKKGNDSEKIDSALAGSIIALFVQAAVPRLDDGQAMPIPKSDLSIGPETAEVPQDAEKVIPQENGGKAKANPKCEVQGVPKEVEVLKDLDLNTVLTDSETKNSLPVETKMPKPEAGDPLPISKPKPVESAAPQPRKLMVDRNDFAGGKAPPEPAISPPVEQDFGESIPPVPPQPQILASGVSPLQIKALDPVISPDGTASALNMQRMNFVAEKNKFAGCAVQKLPPAPFGDALSDNLIEKVEGRPDSNQSGQRRDSFSLSTMIDFAVRTGVLPPAQDSGLENAQKVEARSQVDRVERLVAQEVVTIRQSGANALAVSLKVDPHTDILLQLTTHAGQIQASVRCERGDLTGLDGHWGQLQESLARQNVQLMPMEGKSSANNNSPFNPPSDGGFSRQSGQPSQNPQGQAGNPGNALLMEEGIAGPARIRNSKTPRTAGRKGWETWA